MANAGRVSDGIERIEQLAYPLVGLVNTILGYIVPDAICRGRHLRSEHTASRLDLPALLGFALEPGAGLCRGHMFTPVERL